MAVDSLLVVEAAVLAMLPVVSVLDQDITSARCALKRHSYMLGPVVMPVPGDIIPGV